MGQGMRYRPKLRKVWKSSETYGKVKKSNEKQEKVGEKLEF
jgi:hypothetical protein